MTTTHVSFSKIIIYENQTYHINSDFTFIMTETINNTIGFIFLQNIIRENILIIF